MSIPRTKARLQGKVLRGQLVEGRTAEGGEVRVEPFPRNAEYQAKRRRARPSRRLLTAASPQCARIRPRATVHFTCALPPNTTPKEARVGCAQAIAHLIGGQTL
jgi:hypothetical protein